MDVEWNDRSNMPSEIDLTRTVGAIAAMFPLRLDLSEAYSVAEALPLVARAVRGIPAEGRGYGTLMQSDPATVALLRGLQQPELRLRYGGMPALPEDATAQVGAAPQGVRVLPEHLLLDITAQVVGGRLLLQWWYTSAHERATIQQHAEHAIALLGELCESGQPFDFDSMYDTNDSDVARFLKSLRK